MNTQPNEQRDVSLPTASSTRTPVPDLLMSHGHRFTLVGNVLIPEELTSIFPLEHKCHEDGTLLDLIPQLFSQHLEWCLTHSRYSKYLLRKQMFFELWGALVCVKGVNINVNETGKRNWEGE